MSKKDKKTEDKVLISVMNNFYEDKLNYLEQFYNKEYC